MDAQERARRLRSYVKKFTADELYRQFKARGRKDMALREVTEVLKSVRVYEYYIKELEAKHEREIKALRKELEGALAKVKRLQKQVDGAKARERVELDAVTLTEASEGVQSKKVQARLKDAGKIDAQFKRMKKVAEAKVRGDNLGQAVGKLTHASKDSYENLLSLVETGGFALTLRQKGALSQSSEFRRAFGRWFGDRMSKEEMTELWNETFNTEGTVFNTLETAEIMGKPINWHYKSRRRMPLKPFKLPV